MHLFMIKKNGLNLNLIHNTTDNLDVALYAHLCSDKYIEIRYTALRPDIYGEASAAEGRTCLYYL